MKLFTVLMHLVAECITKTLITAVGRNTIKVPVITNNNVY